MPSIRLGRVSWFLVLTVLGIAGPTRAQIPIASCGEVKSTHSMRQTPNYRQSVDVVASTIRTMTPCLLEVEVEAWVDALPGTYVSVARKTYSAAVSQTRPVPRLGSWQSTAKHFLIFTIPGTWNNLGNTFGQTTVISPPQVGGGCEIGPLDCPEGYEFKPAACACVTLSPIVIDTAGDGYSLTSADNGVVFDLDANGIASEQIAWTEPDSDDAWLVYDRNGNGKIDSATELFGSRTPAYNDGTDRIAENGFDALLLAEGPTYGPSAPDGIIDARDVVFSKLRLWLDRDHNGVSDPTELVPLGDAGVIAIETAYRKLPFRDRHGNRFSLAGHAIVRGPDGRPVKRRIFDVFLTVAGPSRLTATN
jgi:hypothetical protein